jgi:hypothetical protein
MIRDDLLCSRMVACVMLATVFGAIALGCESGPTSPSPDRYRLPRLSIGCNPSGAEVVCTATLFDVPSYGDARVVTQSAAWSVVPPDVGGFTQSGVLGPRRVGEAEIHCRAEGLTEMYAPRFLIGPGQPARWLHFFSAMVRASSTAGPVIDGALVELRDGYQAGQSCVTNQNGVCTIDRVLTGETFTARISRPGYVVKTFTYRVDPPVGVSGNPPSLTVFLDPAN